ncbi:MAG: MarC family protein [Candidatus Micrarchaeia archaeon]|jgi:multiple antibiotic resistance protein
MEPEMAFFFTSFISMMVIINPFSTIATIISLTKGAAKGERERAAFMSSVVAFCVLVFFALSGFLVFQLYSITLEAFRIAGGMVLLIVGLKMFTPDEKRESRHKFNRHTFVVPLAIPMTAGPGAITTAVVLASQAQTAWSAIALWAAIFVACAINYAVLHFSPGIQRALGEDGTEAMTKIMGLLVCAVGVQFIITGLKVAFPLLA